MGRTKVTLQVVAGVSAAGTGILGVWAPLPAWGSNSQWLLYPDNAEQEVEERDLTADGNTAADNGEQQIDRSDIVIGPGYNDIIIQDINYGSYQNYYGITYCAGPDPLPGECNRPISEFNLRQDTTGGWDSIDWKNLGCHEVGHTGGLDEATSTTNPGCMYYAHTRNLSLRDPHDLDIINAHV